MKNYMNNSKNIAVFCLIIIMLLAGCGTTKVAGKFGEMKLAPETKVEIGKIVNQGNAADFDVEVQQICKDSLINKFQKEGCLWTANAAERHLRLDIYLVEYQKGDAFKRWLLPGWGSTVVNVKAEFVDENGTSIGTVESNRTISFGGGYTIGAWKTIFADVANDIYEQFKEKGLKETGVQKK